jgi:hypothetical protein
MTGPASTVPGPQGERGFNGTNGINGTQGPPGITQLINGTNVYTLSGSSGCFNVSGIFVTFATLTCDSGDLAISGGFFQSNAFSDAVTLRDSRLELNQWGVSLKSTTACQPFTGQALCYDNPPLR